MRKYLRWVAKLDSGPAVDPPVTAASAGSFSSSDKRSVPDPDPLSPTSTCPTIASVLWKPLWPPGWHPRTGSSPRPPAELFSGNNPPLITMSRPVDDNKKEESPAVPGDPGTSTPVDEYDVMETWLDDHPAFLKSFFVRKASRSVVDAWLQARTIHASGASSSVSAPVSGATTPVRKISATEFERCSLFLRPMVSTTSDGTPTFLPVTPIGSVPELGRTPPRKSREELQSLDEKQLIFELVKDICNDLDVTSLCHKILQNVCTLLRADRCSLFIVKGSREDPDRHLVSKLFDVSADSTMQQMEEAEEVIIPWGTGIVGHVAASGTAVHISDCYQDKRFSDLVDRKTGYKTKNMLCAPIHDICNEVMGVAQVINKIAKNCDSDPDGADFDVKDMSEFTSYLQFCGIGLRNAQLFERSQIENKRNQVLLDLARMVFEEQSTLEHIVFRIMVHIQSLLEVERCQILLISEDGQYIDSRKAFGRVFDLEASDVGGKDFEKDCSPCPQEGRFPINIGITGYVATTGITLNIPDAYKDHRFDQHVDDNCLGSFKHRSILCMPIKNANSRIIGVSQLVNKINGSPFTQNDEHLFEGFSIFCGMGIHNVQMYESVVKSMAKQKVTLEILSYHATAPVEEAEKFAQAVIPSAAALRLTDFSFSDFSLDEDMMVKAVLRMFMDLDLIERFHMDYTILCRWLLSVRKNYRPVTYHNWRHAFNVCQMMFAILTATGLAHVLGEIETLALLVACLCHDLDHRGTNNSFQVKSSSPLAQLYSTSVMERHHFDQCLMILSSEGNRILDTLSTDEYRQVTQILEEAILATDIAEYFKNRGLFYQLIEAEEYDVIFCGNVSSSGRRLLRGMLMTACDIAAITKPWEVQRVVAQLVASEFFQQGDIEKTQLKMKPIDMMDREKEDELPKMQVSFIDAVCLPVYEAFARLFPDHLHELRDGVVRNRKQWLRLAQEQDALRDWAEQETSKLIDKDEKWVARKGHSEQQAQMGRGLGGGDSETDDGDDD